jgi:hypothetical protein
MNRRAFLLITGGVGLLSPRAGQLREAIDRLAPRRGSDRVARAICRGAVASSASASAQIAQTALPGADIPKYVDPLPVFTGARISAANIDAPQHVPVNAVGPGVNRYPFDPATGQDMSGIAISWITKTTI